MQTKLINYVSPADAIICKIWSLTICRQIANSRLIYFFCHKKFIHSALEHATSVWTVSCLFQQLNWVWNQFPAIKLAANINPDSFMCVFFFSSIFYVKNQLRMVFFPLYTIFTSLTHVHMAPAFSLQTSAMTGHVRDHCESDKLLEFRK